MPIMIQSTNYLFTLSLIAIKEEWFLDRKYVTRTWRLGKYGVLGQLLEIHNCQKTEENKYYNNTCRLFGPLHDVKQGYVPIIMLWWISMDFKIPYNLIPNGPPGTCSVLNILSFAICWIYATSILLISTNKHPK